MKPPLRRFVRAAFALTRQRGRDRDPHVEPRLSLIGEPRLAPSSAGGANAIVHVATKGGPVVVKVRVDAHDDARSEVRALLRAGPAIAPSLIFSSTPAALVARAHALHARALGRDVDLPLGGVIVTGHIAGRHPLRIDDEVVARTARALVALWSKKSDDLAPLRAPSSPQGLVRLLDAIARGLDDARVFSSRDRALVAAAVGRVKKHVARALDRSDWERVRVLCHGDLRWHNLLDDGARVAFVDFEHAGRGDPALDLAMMAARTPLTLHVEHALLDAIVARRRDKSFLDRYFALRPLVALVAGLAAVQDIVDVARGLRPVDQDPARYARARLPHALDELCDAVTQATHGTRPTKRVPVKARVPSPPRARRARSRSFDGVLAVDGTAASGKSVLAEIVARALGIPHWNTGALYRAVALLALEDACDLDDARALRALTARARRAGLSLTDDGGVDARTGAPRAALFVYEVDRLVADVARHAPVRALVDDIVQRARRERGRAGVLIEGRDVATVLAPDARARFFVDAEPALRARRVHERILACASTHAVVGRSRADLRPPTLAAVTRTTARRDQTDASRAIAPMHRARGAILVDTTTGSGEENAARMLRLVERASKTRRAS